MKFQYLLDSNTISDLVRNPAGGVAERLRADLEARGLIIRGLDQLLAAHALALGAVLVTGNVREFVPVRGLAVEDWIVRR